MGHSRCDETVVSVGPPLDPPFGISNPRDDHDSFAIALPQHGDALGADRLRPSDLFGTALKRDKAELQCGRARLRGNQSRRLRPAGIAFAARKPRSLPVIIRGIFADDVVFLLMSAGMSDAMHARKHAKPYADVQPV